MTSYIALLRAVNVGGTGKLPMTELKKMCDEIGFANAKTYIASGNVVFQSALSEARVKAALEKALATYAGAPVQVLVRTAKEMEVVLQANPFPDAEPNRTLAIFLDEAPAAADIEDVKGKKDEELALGKREIYVHYGQGMGQSKLTLRASSRGTGRNMNTIAKLVEMAQA